MRRYSGKDSDMTTDHIDMATIDPSEIVVGSGGQTLAQAAATVRAASPRIVRVDQISRYRGILDEVAAGAIALRAAGTTRIMVDLSVDAPPDGVEFVVRAAEPDDDATVPAWAETATQIAGYVRLAVLALLPVAARALGATGMDATIYVREVGGYWCPEAAGHRPLGDLLAVDGASVAEAALHGWAGHRGPRDAYVLVVPASGASLGVFVDDYTLSTPSPHYERVHAFAALTRSDTDREVATADPIVREMHRAQTTGQRHASRIRAAQAALVQYVLDDDWATYGDIASWVREGGDVPPTLTNWHIGIPQVGGPAGPARWWTADEGSRIVAALVAFELHGVGGPGGFSGGSTATMSWRRGLGKGRRQATDGSAWNAAIEACGSRHVSAADALLAVPHVRPVDLEWPMAYALGRAYAARDDAEESAAWCAVARAVMARAREPGSPSQSGASLLGRRYGVEENA